MKNIRFILRRAKLIVVIPAITLFGNTYYAASGQISSGGSPPSFNQSDVKPSDEIRYVQMEPVDVEALKAEDVYNDKIKDQPWRFGKDLFVALNPDNSGEWETTSDGRLWRLGIESPGALTINITFDNFLLPDNAQLFIYNAEKTEVLGAFTSFNNQKDRYFATTLITGDKIIIEYYEPFDVEFPGEINLWRVTHGYRSLYSYMKSFGDAGSCNVNAVCPEGDPIRNQIRSVAMVILGGGLCTGALINNTAEDGKPYFLTANHCYDNAGTAVFRFNWQSATCTNPATSPGYNTINGSVHRARYEPSDFWLVELNQTPPAEYEVYYSGWNRTTASSIVGKVYGIHHPAGDIKKISWSNGGVVTSDYTPNPTGSPVTHWKVTSWSDGTTTEGGSSGSPLYDPQYRIIGQLHGGWADCGNTLSDYYGNLAYSWTGGGTNSTRLSNWLDPLSTGVTVLQGYDPNVTQFEIDAELKAILQPQPVYSSIDTIVPTIQVSNNGSEAITEAEISYRLDTASPVVFSWSGTLAANDLFEIGFPELPITVGLHTIMAKVEVPGDENPSNDSLVKEFIVSDCSALTFPIVEGFDSATLSPCWTSRLVSGTSPTLTYVSTGTSPDCLPSQGPRMIEFNSNISDIGSSIRLESPIINTIGMDSVNLSFDWQHDNAYSAAIDRLVIQYSVNSSDWINVDTVYRYDALIAGWDRKNISLPQEIDHQPEVYIGLLFVSAHGRNCHLDSLVIEATSIDEPYADFSASLTNIYLNDTISFTDGSFNGPFSTWKWYFGEGAEPDSADGQGPHEVYYTNEGYKTITLVLDQAHTKIKEDYIYVNNIDFEPPYNLSAEVIDKDVLLTWTLFKDDFETGDFSKWAEMIEGPGTPGDGGFAHWWVITDDRVAYEGDCAAMVNWGFTIDTWLISPEIPVDNNTILSFIWSGSYSWNVDPYDHGDLFVKVSADSGVSWEPVWTFGEIGTWEDWVWYETVIDLSDYEGSLLKIAFNIVADDNGDILLDDVYFGNSDERAKRGTLAISDRYALDLGQKSAGSLNPGYIPLNRYAAKKMSLLDYTVFRDEVEIGKTSENYYTDPDLPKGSYYYYVIANYINPEGSSGPSNIVNAKVGPDIIPVLSGIAPVVYPNPSDGRFNFDIAGRFRLVVTSANGTLAGEFIVEPNIQSIDLTHLEEGLYFLQFISDEASFTRKIMIDR